MVKRGMEIAGEGIFKAYSWSMATAQITKGCCRRLEPLGGYVQALLLSHARFK